MHKNIKFFYAASVVGHCVACLQLVFLCFLSSFFFKCIYDLCLSHFIAQQQARHGKKRLNLKRITVMRQEGCDGLLLSFVGVSVFSVSSDRLVEGLYRKLQGQVC